MTGPRTLLTNGKIFVVGSLFIPSVVSGSEYSCMYGMGSSSGPSPKFDAAFLTPTIINVLKTCEINKATKSICRSIPRDVYLEQLETETKVLIEELYDDFIVGNLDTPVLDENHHILV
ncbi:hypothetical protein BC830DRAFT_1126009 [Chytriomyces sp. MP71]|nr:hypothetical protein BC830DRAFT_1126009 [Chytriomyces sp. MP71]